MTFSFLFLFFFVVFFCYKNVEGFKQIDIINPSYKGDGEIPFNGVSGGYDENLDKEESRSFTQNVNEEENSQNSSENDETRKDVGVIEEVTKETKNCISSGDDISPDKSETHKLYHMCDEDKKTDDDESETITTRVKQLQTDQTERESILDNIKRHMRNRREANNAHSYYITDDTEANAKSNPEVIFVLNEKTSDDVEVARENKSNVDPEIENIDQNKGDLLEDSVSNDKTDAPEEIEVSEVLKGGTESSLFIKKPIELPIGNIINLYKLYRLFGRKYHISYTEPVDTDDVTFDIIPDETENVDNTPTKIPNKRTDKTVDNKEKSASLNGYTFLDNMFYKASTFIVPGIGGSTLLAEYKNAYIPSCSDEALNSHPFRIWISISRILSIRSNLFCIVDTLKLLYNKRTKMYYNQKGVEVGVERYGHLKGINYLDYFGDVGISGTKYFYDMTHYFLTKGKYESNESLIGAPYDWRYPLRQQNYHLFKQTVEYIYEKRNKFKINLVGHSLGCLYINYFLNHKVSKRWKQKYINSIIYINGPFKGAFKIVRALVHGNGDFISLKLLDLAKFQVPDAVMKTLNSSLGSVIDLIPYREYYNKDQIVIIMNLGLSPISKKDMTDLIKTCGLYNIKCYKENKRFALRVYSLSDWTSLLSPQMQERIKEQKKYMDRQFKKDHGVPIFCVNSMLPQLETEQILFFQSTDITTDPYIFYGAGDGTVNAESLNACNLFYNRRESKIFINVNHQNILKHNEAIHYIFAKATAYYKSKSISELAEGSLSERFVGDEALTE